MPWCLHMFIFFSLLFFRLCWQPYLWVPLLLMELFQVTLRTSLFSSVQCKGFFNFILYYFLSVLNMCRLFCHLIKIAHWHLVYKWRRGIFQCVFFHLWQEEMPCALSVVTPPKEKENERNFQWIFVLMSFVYSWGSLLHDLTLTWSWIWRSCGTVFLFGHYLCFCHVHTGGHRNLLGQFAKMIFSCCIQAHICIVKYSSRY